MRCLIALAMAIAFVVNPGFTRPTEAREKGRPIDIALCLDTSNSMDGLIDSAKVKLWAIVNELIVIKPTPTLRVALYQYGNDNLNPKSGWVRKELDLTTDLDEVYGRLNALRTRGGTEYVARVSRDALNDLKWSEGPDATRLIFVCGNEPANQDNEISLESVAATARRQKIIINTIYCGSADNHEAIGWRDFAKLAGGKYANIDQNRAVHVVVIDTPHDAEILKLNQKLNETYICYGKHGRAGLDNQTAQDNNALGNNKAGGAPEASLSRSQTKASGFYSNATWDIIDRQKQDSSFDVSKLKDEDLSDELRQLKPADRAAYVQKRADERVKIQQDIQALSAKRAAFIAAAAQKQPATSADTAFDESIKAMLREQTAAAGN